MTQYDGKLTLELMLLTRRDGDHTGGHGSFKIDIKQEDGTSKTFDVFIVPKREVVGLGEVRSDRIYVQSGIPAILMPVILQKIYYRSKGYDDEATTAAAMVYGSTVLTSEDYSRLAALLGQKTDVLARIGSLEGNQEYYLECLGSYASSYGGNRWVRLARSYDNMGMTSASYELGRGVHASRMVLEEGPILKTDSNGVKTEVEPALRDVLPEVVSGLETLAHSLENQKETIRISIRDHALMRTLYLLSDDIVEGSPIVFRDGNYGKGGSDIEFHCNSAKYINSVLKNLRVDLTREHEAVKQVLTAAKKVYGELSSGMSFRGLLESGKDITPEDAKGIINQMERLGRMNEHYRRAITGVPKKTPGISRQNAP